MCLSGVDLKYTKLFECNVCMNSDLRMGTLFVVIYLIYLLDSLHESFWWFYMLHVLIDKCLKVEISHACSLWHLMYLFYKFNFTSIY